MSDHIELILTLVNALWGAVLVGNTCPNTRKLYEYMHARPVLGDLVVEKSTTYHLPKDPSRIGYFLRTESSVVCRHERDDVNLERCPTCTEDERCMDHFTWIRCLDDENRRHRWHNCGFLRLPKNLRELRAITG